ncbi:hypothetical protein PIB30_011443 [Stylosanthes scabra]|uniref:Uncharacterized protein n=1 Tax=Stylosanthes scabra TaxID=79078 RepID=A0ABU6Q5R2_9FABA|nr:hypothetical protein [Stylosanthes scabra]
MRCRRSRFEGSVCSSSPHSVTTHHSTSDGQTSPHIRPPPVPHSRRLRSASAFLCRLLSLFRGVAPLASSSACCHGLSLSRAVVPLAASSPCCHRLYLPSAVEPVAAGRRAAAARLCLRSFLAVPLP